MQNSILSPAVLTVILAFGCIATAENASATTLAEPCEQCHGPGGVSKDPATPVIAGLSRGFLIGAMLAYKHADDVASARSVVENDPELADIVVLRRPAIAEQHIPPDYTVDQIKQLAKHFAAQHFTPPQQTTDAAKAAKGSKLHTRYCEKCHEDGGASTADDVGLLAGQWMPYLDKTLADFVSGDREMPKKMSQKMDVLRKKEGDEALQLLANYYASQH